MLHTAHTEIDYDTDLIIFNFTKIEIVLWQMNKERLLRSPKVRAN